MGMELKTDPDKNITIIAIDKDVDEKINELCMKKNMSRDLFLKKALETYSVFCEIDPNLVKRMNDACEEHGMGKLFFFTKAIENYCKNLARKKKKDEK
jgi:predicted transcriptional regulator